MTTYSKFNVIYRLQKWLDSVPGQTFMNYAYSWGASIVILGALFKLTHLPGANFMLFLGMGTEVLVFFIAGFDRPFDKTEDGKDLPTHVEDEDLEMSEGTTFVGGGTGTGGTIILGGGGSTGTTDGQVAAQGQGSIIFGDTATGDTVAAQGQGGVIFGGGVSGAPLQEVPEIDTEGMEEATTSYVEQLKKLTETLQKVSEMNERLTTDSEEMEKLNRTLTGISRVYELQLKGASQQIGTIEQINEQNQRLADQIAELNKIYARMIEAMTSNMANRVQ